MMLAAETWLLFDFALFFVLAFVVRSWLVWRKSGINPLVLPRSDDAYGYVGRAFKSVIAAAGLLALGLFAWPDLRSQLGLLPAMDHVLVTWVGWALLAMSLLVLLIAQAQMGLSWRIGVDTQHPTALVEDGLFSVSRNPIFLAMRVHLLGLFLVLPCAVTLAMLIAAEVLMQVQVRLEEQHLLGLHGDAYVRYAARVRRWL